MPVTINGTTGIAGVDGSASTPAVQGTDTNTGIFFPATDTIAFGEGGTEVMRIDSSGRVGIGTSSPVRQLTVYEADTPIFALQNSTTGTTANDGTLIYVSGVDANIKNKESTGGILFQTGGDTERARITSGGYFKASNSGSYQDSTGTYHEFYQTASDKTLYITATNASYASDVFLARADRNTTNGTFKYIRCYNGGAGNDRFLVADSGNATNVNGSYGTISDLKLKQDITDATPQWDDIKSLRFRKYRLKSEVELDPNAKPFLGLVAQEAELVCPGLVEEHIDRDSDDNDLGTTTKSIKTSILYMKAVKALQEAMTRIETLEAQNAAFEARLAALEAK